MIENTGRGYGEYRFVLLDIDSRHDSIRINGGYYPKDVSALQ